MTIRKGAIVWDEDGISMPEWSTGRPLQQLPVRAETSRSREIPKVGARHAVPARLPSRRGLLRAALLALSAVAPGFTQTYDLLLQGGHVLDPGNKIDRVVDIAVREGKIAKVAPDIPTGEAKKTIKSAATTSPRPGGHPYACLRLPGLDLARRYPSHPRHDHSGSTAAGPAGVHSTSSRRR